MPTTYAIPNGRTAFDATLYNGTGTAQNISNADNGTVGFKPDLVWLKSRNNARNNALFDSLRGANDVLISNSTNNAATETAGSMSAFNSNGFSLASGSASFAGVNVSGDTMVGWQWQAGQGTTSNNTSGTITSTVSANTTAGFSVVTYTGTGANATVGHGLGVTPQFMIFKNRSAVASWECYHVSLGATQTIRLNSTAAAITSSTTYNNTAPTSTVFSLGSDNNANGNGNNQVAYCWTPIPGFSQFGSYTGNGSTDGPFVYLGFRPKWILIKNASDGAVNWLLEDTTRSTYNVMGAYLFPNSSAAESTNTYADFLSNGFKIRDNGATYNGNGNTMIYAAFAENPFKYANAR